MSVSRVYVASDHAGFELKAALVKRLREQGREVVDCGPLEFDASDDYGLAGYLWTSDVGCAHRPGFGPSLIQPKAVEPPTRRGVYGR